VPVIANGFRASGIILIAHWSDMEYATGADHITFGWIFFAIVLLIFISIAMTFTNRGLHDRYIDFSKDYWLQSKAVAVKSFILFSFVTVVFVGMAPIYASVIEQRYQTFENHSLNLNGDIWGKDISGHTDWKPHYAGASQTFYHRIKPEASSAVDIFVAYYKYQSKESEMIRFGNTVVQEDVWSRISSGTIEADISGSKGTVNEILLQSGRRKRIALYWYWVDGDTTASTYEAKILNVKAKLLGGRLDSAVIVLSALVESDNINQKREELLRVAASLPHLGALVGIESKSE
ncbi:MAG: EpsI family protein, partial [Emcibacter sp.]|nr:EpsI family protein [Emcibacter sp.]